MSGSDRDLVLALRSEVAAVDPSRPCDRRAEALGLGGLANARDSPLARLLLRLARERAAVQAGAEAAGPAGSLAAFDWSTAPEHCRLAWLRGLFLARGSLSLSGGRTHLEFVVGADEAELLA